jgi:hypothetical protein
MAIAEDLVVVVGEIEEAQLSLAAILAQPAADGTRLDSGKDIPETHQSLSALDGELVTVSQSIKGIAEQNDLPFVPLKHLTSALVILRQILQYYSAAKSAITASPTILSIDQNSYGFTGDDGISRGISKELKGASEAVEELLTDWHLLRLAAKSPRINDFASFLRINEKHRQTLESALDGMQKLKGDAQTATQSISTLEVQATNAQTEIERIKSVIQTDRKTANEYLAEATTKLEGIRKTSSDADSLTAAIAEYDVEFERFKVQLDERTKKFNDGTLELSNLIARLRERESVIDVLVTQSEGMLVGATNAGLAGSLSKRFLEIASEVTKARTAYYFSICLLIFATIPIAFDMIPRELLGSLLKKISGGYIEITSATDKIAPSDLLGHVLARALLLIPAFLLVRFAAARHERLFRLREHYAYKYSIASSVEGFKQQSPDQYKDYVAMIAFNELTFNPATQMEARGSETKHLNPILDAAMKKMGLAPEQQA